MSSGFGINSKASANSKAYVESPFWDKQEEKKKAEAEEEEQKRIDIREHHKEEAETNSI